MADASHETEERTPGRADCEEALRRLDEALWAAEEALVTVKKYREEASRLIEKYGDGVRSSWVSTDISIAPERASFYRKAAGKMEGMK